jgi:hypothetical protein
MKPQGNKLGIWTDRNARSQRTVGTQEKARAESRGSVLPENLCSLNGVSHEILRGIVYET